MLPFVRKIIRLFPGAALLLLVAVCSLTLTGARAHVASGDEPPVSVVEVRYEKLMKVYLNKIKLAFSETDDVRSLAILNQFLPEFSQKSEALKNELQGVLKALNAAEKEKVMNRLNQRVNVEELMALFFDERVSARMAANPEIRAVMDQLYAKSLEVQKPGNSFIAAD